MCIEPDTHEKAAKVKPKPKTTPAPKPKPKKKPKTKSDKGTGTGGKPKPKPKPKSRRLKQVKKFCASEDEVKKWYVRNPLVFIYKDMFTNKGDVAQPVKYYVNDRYKTGLQNNESKRIDFFIQKGVLKQSYMLKTTSEKIFSVGKPRETTYSMDTDFHGAYFTMTVQLDDMKVKVNRAPYDWVWLFIAIGGFERSWKKIFGMVVG